MAKLAGVLHHFSSESRVCSLVMYMYLDVVQQSQFVCEGLQGAVPQGLWSHVTAFILTVFVCSCIVATLVLSISKD